MKPTRTCPNCGRTIASDELEGLCPRCLMAKTPEERATIASASGFETAFLAMDASEKTARADLGTIRYFGDYELLDEIARGGMGIVYKARQKSLNRTVAVKMILAGQLARPEDVRRFHTEAEAAANLQHPNIVAIHEVGEHQGQHYFSMDLVDGKPLSDFAQNKPVECRHAAELVRTLAEAIQYAHQRGILHRDLKPQNVLLDERGQPRITDFGLARKLEQESDLTATGSIVGSPSYMAPEQASANQSEVGPASDVYGLGAILYYLLTGAPPFLGATALATVLKVQKDEPGSPRTLNPRVPVDLETICLKCLEKQPERRYAHARALVEDLNRFLNDEPVLARPASAWRKSLSWSRRHPWAIVFGLATAMVLLLGALFWLQTENDFLRYLKTHPEYVSGSRPRFEKVSKVFRSFGAVLAGAMVSGIVVGIGCGILRAARPGLITRINLACGNLLGLLPNCLLGAICLAYGIAFLKTGVEGRIWNGDRIILPTSLGFGLLYLGLYAMLEARLIYRAFQDPAGRRGPLADLFSGLPELARKDFKGFWQKAVSKEKPQSAPRLHFTPLRIVSFVLLCFLARWIGQVFGQLPGLDFGNHAFVGFLFHVFIGLGINGTYWAVKTGKMSSWWGAGTIVMVWLTFVLVYLAIYLSLAAYGSLVLGPMLAQTALGSALGLAAAFQIVHWKTPLKQ